MTPKRVALDLRSWLEGAALRWGLSDGHGVHGGDGEEGAPGGVSPVRDAEIDDAVVWACTTCGACAAACPVYVKHPPLLVELREYLVMMEGALPSEAQPALRNIETNYSPWGIGWVERENWAAGLDIQVAGDVA